MSLDSDLRSPDLRRERDEVLAEYVRRRAGYVPDWLPGVDDPDAAAAVAEPGLAVVRAEASMLASLWERLDQVPDKHKLAFLAELGVDSLPPAAARAPVAFEPLPLAGSSVVPEGSLVGATGDDGSQVTFRTEDGVGVASSRLAEVRTVVPGRDTVGDHTIDAIGGRPITLFTDQVATERHLYLGHDSLFAIRGSTTIAVELELTRDSRVPLTAEWSLWDGSMWRTYEFDPPPETSDDPRTFGRSGVVALSSTCVESAPTTVDGIEAYWVRVRLTSPLALVEPLALPEIDQVRVAVEIGTPQEPVEYAVETALALGRPADLSGPFYPFGQAPDRTVALYVDATAAVAAGPQRMTFKGYPEVDGAAVESDGEVTGPDPDIEADYWDGREWRHAWTSALGVGVDADGDPVPFAIDFPVPPNWTSSEVAGTTGTWLRLRLARGASYLTTEPVGTAPNTVDVDVQRPVRLSDLAFTVYGRSPAVPADHVLSYDGALYTDHTSAARWRGEPFTPFRPREDRTDALYLGFDGPLPAADLGLYLEVEPDPEDDGGPPEHELRWERHDGTRWVSLPVEDETRHLTATGIVRLLWPGNRQVRTVQPVVGKGRALTAQRTADAHRFEVGELVHVREGEKGELATVAAIEGTVLTTTKDLENSYQAATLSEPELPLFGMPRTWVRARLTAGSPQPDITLRRVLPNVVWAAEQRRVERQQLGAGTGQPNQRLFATSVPLLPGVVVEVRELSGARARTDLPILERELAGTGHGVTADPDPQGEVTEVWVGWEVRGSLTSSGPSDRNCVVDLVRGILRFGDDRHGRSLPPGALVRISADVGGGSRGNLPSGAVENPLSGMVVASVTNPAPATGGADAETAIRARRRAPEVVRHRYQAVTREDYRAVALEASPEVFDAAVVAIDDDLGGRLRLHVLPASVADDPTPSDQLLERVARHLRRRCPVGAADLLDVTSPVFVPVGVAVTLAALPGDSELVFDRVRSALRDFLHPVTGGPAARTATEPLTAGWRFGATIHTARFAQLLEAVPGVDHVEGFVVTRDGAYAGDVIQLDADAVPLPGTFDVTLVRAEATP